MSTIEKEIAEFLTKFAGSDPIWLAKEIEKRWLAASKAKDDEIKELKRLMRSSAEFMKIDREKIKSLEGLLDHYDMYLEKAEVEIERLQKVLDKIENTAMEIVGGDNVDIDNLQKRIKDLEKEKRIWYTDECLSCSGFSERAMKLVGKIKELEAELKKKGGDLKPKEGKI